MISTHAIESTETAFRTNSNFSARIKCKVFTLNQNERSNSLEYVPKKMALTTTLPLTDLGQELLDDIACITLTQ